MANSLRSLLKRAVDKMSSSVEARGPDNKLCLLIIPLKIIEPQSR